MRLFTSKLTPAATFFLFSFLLVFFFSSNGSAETLYVSDYLIVNVRDNVEKPYSVVATVQSDDALEVLEESGRYVKVRTSDGSVGWIAKQYLKQELPKKLIIEQLETEISSLKEQISSLKQYEELSLNPDQIQQTVLDLQAQNSNLNNELNVLVQTNHDLEQELTELRKLEIVSDENIDLLSQYESAKAEIESLQNSIEELQQQLQKNEETANELSQLKSKYEDLLFTAQNSEAIAEERNLLKQKNEENQNLISTLQLQVAELRNNQLIYWFLAGAAVFIVGMIFGRVNVKKKKRLSLS